MIEINLLPEELKPKKQVHLPIPASFTPQHLIYLAAGALGILVFIHVVLLLLMIKNGAQLSSLNSKWKALEPEKVILDNLRKEFEVSAGDARAAQQIGAQRDGWARKLNRLSLDLPSGVWLDDLSLSGKDFLLKASAVSLQKEELTLINKFLEGLKADAEFFGAFQSLELGPLQRRSVGGYDILDFVLIGKLK
jgi:Tfp pilus assembly protein PilN